MFFHLGQDYVLNTRDIVGIFDLETTTVSARGQDFLRHAQQEGAVVTLAGELPKSYVLAQGAFSTLYLTPLSPAVVARRAAAPLAEEPGAPG